MTQSIENPRLRIDDAPSGGSYDSKDAPRLARSPREYTRRHSEVLSATLKVTGHCEPSLSSADNSTCQTDIASKAFIDSDNRKRRKNSSSPSDSGSEADDESGPLLKSLPAPPLRLRKGLKNESAQGTHSPLLTPSYLDDEKRRVSFEASFKRRGSLQSHASTDEETLAVRDKFRKRRRAELIRRLTETILLLSIGFVASWKNLLLPLRKGNFRSNQVAK
ncbi:MAG: hypothetical protein Q9198_004611 [Flavoplaca austrocitrina]